MHEFKPVSGNIKYLMVMLHGLASNGADLFNLVPFLSCKLEDVAFIAPDGIAHCDQAPFGYQWFSLKDRSPEIMAKELEIAAPKIMELIDNKAKQYEIDKSNIILFGFSQGAMTSLYLALDQKEPFHSVIACSGALIEPKKINNIKTPICLIHGQEDEVVPYTSMEIATETLTSLKVENESLGIKNLAHSIDIKGIEATIKFIKSRA